MTGVLGLGERPNLGAQELAEVFYAALLRYLPDAHEMAEMVGGDDIGVG